LTSTTASPRAARRVDRASAIPYYYQLKQILSDAITSGELAPGAQLPGEHEFCALYDVSRTVVRQALNELCYGKRQNSEHKPLGGQNRREK